MDGDQDELTGGHPVLELVAQLQDLAGKLAVATAWSMSDPQSREAVRAGHRALAMVESAWLGLVRDLDTRPGAVPGARAGHTARTFLIHALHRSGPQAGADVRAARALDPDRAATDGGLPTMAAAFADGEVTRRHVDAAVRVINNLPAAAARATHPDAPDGSTGADRVDAFLAEQAREVCPDTLTGMGRQILAVLDPDGADRHDPDAHRRRAFSMTLAPDGMTVGRFQLAAAQAAVVRAALEAFAAPQPASEQPDEHGQATLVADERTGRQRMADAFAALARAALAHDGSTRAEPTQVTVITDLDQLADARNADADAHNADADGGDAGSGGRGGEARPAGLAHCVGHGPISRTALGLLACDAALRAVILDPHGAVLHLGRSHRTASKAQRIALAARDRGCVIPGCPAPAGICDAHHVTYWSHGGSTDIDHLALLCPRHHTDLHHGVWALEMRYGIPWARPPGWVHPDRPLLRNTIHHTHDPARRLGHQLRLDLDTG